MIGTVNDIAIALLKNARGSDEKIVCAVWRKEDIRHVTGEGALNEEEIRTVLERLDAELEYGANTALIQSIAEGVRESSGKTGRSLFLPRHWRRSYSWQSGRWSVLPCAPLMAGEMSGRPCVTKMR